MFEVAATLRSPTARLVIAVAVAFALIVPIFFVWMLIYDRQQQSEHSRASIAQGWGGAQTISGPVLVIPYRDVTQQTLIEDGREIVRNVEQWSQRTIAPEAVELVTDLRPERRTRSIYEAIVYEALTQGRARFTIPADIQRYGIDPSRLDLSRAELRFGLSDPRGLGANPAVTVGGTPLRLQPGAGSGGGGGGNSGFFAWLDASSIAAAPIDVTFAFALRGNETLALAPQAGDTRWTVTSSWQHPSFQGSFLPSERSVDADGFRATYRVGNLALGQSLVSGGAPAADSPPRRTSEANPPPPTETSSGASPAAQIDLVQPVDLYSQVGRATKYGFLFVGFTFLALLLFDIVGGARVRAAEYLLVGVGLVLFFVLLLAFAEVIGFEGAYLLAAGAISGLITFYSAAVLRSWRRAGAIAALMAMLYGVLYLLLSMEAFSLLIGSVLLFGALAAVMYLTRNLDWGGGRGEAAPVAGEGAPSPH
jgi:inner membrane protein